MTRPIIIAILGVITLAIALYAVAQIWADYGITLTLHGWIAYSLGCLASIGLAAGLFWLTFKSAREGYDDIDRDGPFQE